MNDIKSSEIIPMTVNSLLEVLNGLKENGHGDLEIIHSHNFIFDANISEYEDQKFVWFNLTKSE